ncbi:MAG: hypothetical protein WC683_02785 [bacterium]
MKKPNPHPMSSLTLLNVRDRKLMPGRRLRVTTIDGDGNILREKTVFVPPKRSASSRYAVLVEARQPFPHFRLVGVFPTFEAAQRRADRIKRSGLSWWGPLGAAKRMLLQGEKWLEVRKLTLARELRTVEALLCDVRQERETAAPVKRKR